MRYRSNSEANIPWDLRLSFDNIMVHTDAGDVSIQYIALMC